MSKDKLINIIAVILVLIFILLCFAFMIWFTYESSWATKQFTQIIEIRRQI
jgi:flagellar basal body-associated protein FliL